ncbi:maleylpyruvate isomerase N-terminal domain-containing protein [Streptomyces sp. DW26H14]|uniref:maleylpyruvate isomerase N-terminal domain-containing protein n=1 Tax=Streptomyces sp. DW26H14 TaxID=3435395 RepID=UPI00403DDD0B
MTLLSHGRYCDEIIGQADALCALLDGAGPGALGRRVPTCPDWDAEQLVRHVGEVLCWVRHIVEERAREGVSVRDVPGAQGPEDPRELTAWLARSARLVAGALREAGPDVPVWSWAWEATTGFWARRMCHEVVIHRADAVFSQRAGDAPPSAYGYRLDPAVAADTLDEWLRIVEFAVAAEGAPRPPAGVGGTLHLHATDVADAEWLIEIGGQDFRWRRAHARADTAVRAPLTALLLASVRRLPVQGPEFEVIGDRPLLDFWLDTARFG